MRQYFIFLNIIILFGIFSPLAHALSRKDLTFYVPFEDSLKASYSKGNPFPIGKVDNKMYHFVEGIKSNGLITGKAIKYQIKDNMNNEEGTFSIWIKPVKWHAPDGKNHYFAQFYFKNVVARLYFYYPGQMGVLFQQRGKTVFTCFAWSKLKKGNFYHLVFTYKAGELSFYLDGVAKAHKTEGVIPFKKGKKFHIAVNAATDTVFDELLIFNRVLTPTEIKALYQRESIFEKKTK